MPRRNKAETDVSARERLRGACEGIKHSFTYELKYPTEVPITGTD